MKRVALISTGSELLNGSKVDTNSSYLAQELYKQGFTITSHMTSGDDLNSLIRIIDNSAAEADIIILTGGLGPTDDDNTIEALQKIFCFSIVHHEGSKQKMFEFFKIRGRKIDESDLKMVAIPENGVIIDNTAGLAPGFILDKQKPIVVALPGVPNEMSLMMTKGVMPYLLNHFGLEKRTIVAYKLVGLKESEINSSIKSMDIGLSETEWGMTADSGIVSVTFTAKNERIIDEDRINSLFKEVFKENLLTEDFSTVREELISILILKGLTLATAESCTGGLISKQLTDVPGASKSFIGGVIAYSNEVKEKYLSVSGETLKEKGAVSEEVAAEMASGIRKELGADIGLAVTGVAGPGGGTELKPVGTVCFGFDIKGEIVTFTQRIPGDRERVRMFTAQILLDHLRRYFRKNNK